MPDYFDTDVLSVFLQIVLIDLVLAGDNAIVIGLASAGLPEAQRGKAIFIGIIAATILRVLLAGLATQILQIVGLLLAGGILLLWVCWKMWRELRTSSTGPTGAMDAAGAIAGSKARKTLAQASWQIVVADVSMSLDNVLAVAGSTRASDNLDFRPRAFHRDDGHGRFFHCTPSANSSMDCLRRSSRHPLCGG